MRPVRSELLYPRWELRDLVEYPYKGWGMTGLKTSNYVWNNLCGAVNRGVRMFSLFPNWEIFRRNEVHY